MERMHVLALLMLAAAAAPAHAADPKEARAGAAAHRSGPSIPEAHYPPRGLCRIWHPDRRAARQPPPVKCDRIGSVPRGAWLIRG